MRTRSSLGNHLVCFDSIGIHTGPVFVEPCMFIHTKAPVLGWFVTCVLRMYVVIMAFPAGENLRLSYLNVSVLSCCCAAINSVKPSRPIVGKTKDKKQKTTRSCQNGPNT